MARLTLALLGGFEARLDGRASLRLPAKVKALLAFLALHPGQGQPREKLAGLLWSATTDEQARSNLRHALFTVRKAVSAVRPRAVVSDGETVALASGATEVDVLEFERLVREGTSAALERAANLYQGQFLDGLGVGEPAFEEWLHTERERLRELALEALSQLLTHESRAGLTQRAIQTATRLLALDPLQEAVHRTLMHLYARQGRRATALKQYQVCVEVMRRELGAEPESQTRQLYQELRERRDATALTDVDVSADARPSPTRRTAEFSEGERKHVTVLCADVAGSTDVLFDRDPEEARRLLDSLLEMMVEDVRRYGGTVTTIRADGIIALFGAPRAQEDHALRACYAALTLQETIMRTALDAWRKHGLEPRIRIGLNSGDVVLRAIDGDLRADYSVMSQTARLAARVEPLAASTAIRLTAETQRLVDGYVDVRSLGRFPVHGVREDVEGFEVTDVNVARTRLHVAVSRGLTPFVGREAELAQLARAAEATWKAPGRVVAVIGEPGEGKSRLLHELAHAERFRGWRILETAGIAYGATTSYLPIVALLKSYLRVEARDTPREIADKLRRTLLALNPSLEAAMPALAALLDAAVDDKEWPVLDPPQRRRHTLDAVKQLLIRSSQERPLLLLFENLHWIDGESQAVLDGLVDTLPRVRMLLVVTYRPEYAHGWASKSQYTQLRLQPLTETAAAKLLRTLLGTDPGLEDVERLLIERTQGNPFFLEESVRTLVEAAALTGERGAYRLARPIERLQLPATVQAILAARIDRLDPADKRLLQAAAVVGKDVPLALLQAIAEEPEELVRQSVTRLQAAELLYEARLFPELEYTFMHALTHEVTYIGMLPERRSALHRGIVEAIEQLHAGHLNEHLERLAHHALRGEVWERAVHYLRQAGGKAAARSALPEAQGWLEQALGVVDRLPDSAAALEQAFEIRLELRPVLSLLGETRRALERLREAEALAERLNDDRRRGRVCAFMTNIHMQFDELDEARASGARALAIARAQEDLDLQILTTTYLAEANYFGGEYERAVELATDNLATLPAERIHERFGNASPVSVYDRNWLISSLAELGRFREATRYADEAIDIAKRTRHAFTEGIALTAARRLYTLKGDWVKARSVTEQGIGVVRAGDVLLLLPPLIAVSAMILAQLGERREALSRLHEGEQLLERQAMNSRNLGVVCLFLSRACLLLGDLEKAWKLGDRAVEHCRRQPGFAAHALHLLGDIETHPERFDAAHGEARYRRALALADPRGMRPLIAHCHLGLGTLYRRAGKRSEAVEHITSVTTMCREMGMTYLLERAEVQLK